MRTFSRRAKSLTSPAKPGSGAEQGPDESFLLNSSDPFFFPEAQEAAQPRSSKLAASPASKAGGGAASGKRAGAGPTADKAAATGKASGAGAAAGPARQQKGATTGSNARSTQAAAKQRAAAKPTASLLSHRNSSGSLRQLQHKAEGGSQEQAAPAGGRPSVLSKAAAAPAAAASKAAGPSPGKRKAPAAPEAAAAEPEAVAAGSPDTSPSKKMKKGGSGGNGDSSQAAAAAGVPGAAPARASGGAARPAAPAAGKAPAGPRPGQQAGAAPGGAAALVRLVNPAALRDQAAATTVVQAQALGEQQSITDDALWALDGLSSSSDATVRDSLAALAEICATRRGRLALRSGNVAGDILVAAGGLKLQRDPVQALGLATLLLCFCQADADAALLARQEVAAAAAHLLKLSSALVVAGDASAAGSSAGGAAAGGTAAAKLLGLLKERPYSAQLPAEERGSPLGVALVALAGVLNPHEGSLNTEPLKAALRQAGVLQAAAQVAADHAPALSDASPTIQTVRSLWRLHKALLLLENACFACPDNEALLLAVQVRSGVEPLISTAGLVSCLVQQLGLLSCQALITGIKKDCLRALLAVLMNLTQNNPAGCAAVVEAGALVPVASLLAQMVRGGPKIKGVAAGREELAVWLDELSGCLALLINLVEHQPAWRDQLRHMQLPDTRGASGSAGGRVQLVPLLCALLAAVAPRSKGVATPTAAAASLGRRLSLGSGEVTLDCLESVDDGGAASIVEAYGAILLGFLIQDCGEARAQAAALLPGGSLEPVVAAVERCLHFYITAGAMTKSNVESLSALLASLQQHQDQAGAAATGDAGAAAPPAAAAAGSGEHDGGSLSPVLE